MVCKRIKIELFAGTFGKPQGDATNTNNSTMEPTKGKISPL
jgi:hypothetical protein